MDTDVGLSALDYKLKSFSRGLFQGVDYKLKSFSRGLFQGVKYKLMSFSRGLVQGVDLQTEEFFSQGVCLECNAACSVFFLPD